MGQYLRYRKRLTIGYGLLRQERVEEDVDRGAARIGCNRVSVLLMSVRVEGALDIMRSADAEPNGSKAFDGHDCYRLYRAADRSAEHDRYFSSATRGSGCCMD